MSEERLQQLEEEVAALRALIERSGITVLDSGVIAGHGRYRRLDFLNASLTDRGDRIEVDVTGGTAGNHALDSATHIDVVAQANQRGDLLTRGPTQWDRLPLGASGQYARSNGTDPAWSAILDADLPAALMRDAEHLALGDAAPHHAKFTDAEAVSAVPYVIYVPMGSDQLGTVLS